jgi:hypothetical protein
VFADNKEVDFKFVSKIASILGYKCSGEIYDTGYIIEVPQGQEESAGAQFVEDYPEFFSGYERFDVNLDNAYESCDDIIYDIENLRDSLGSLNEFGKPLLPENWNENIDEIIDKLNNLKY